MITHLFNKIFSIDKFFYNYLSINSEHNIFNNNENIESFFRIITKFGEGYFELFLITVLLSFFLFNKKKFYILKKYIFAIFFTLLSTQVVVSILKLTFGRARPSLTSNPEIFYGILNLMKNHLLFKSSFASMPSGHTITIWGTVWILHFCIKNKYIKIPLFILGFLVGFSRIYLGVHWFTDVITSIILSYFIAKFVYNKIKVINWNIQKNYKKNLKKLYI